MPYALSEKQREYQRKWVKLRRKPVDIPRLPALSSSIITWEELTKSNVADSCTTWEQCKKACKEFMLARRVNRIAVAMLAIRACTIRHGGDFRSRKFREKKYGPTIKDFAAEIEVHTKTLYDWMAVTSLVVNNLPKGTTQVDYHAARLAVEQGRDRPIVDILKDYDSFSEFYSPKRYITRLIRELHAAAYVVRVHGDKIKKHMVTKDREKFLELLSFIRSLLKE